MSRRYAPIGHYAVNSAPTAGSGADNAPLHALANGVDGGNGVYGWRGSRHLPANTFNSENYWVDIVYASTLGPTPRHPPSPA